MNTTKLEAQCALFPIVTEATRNDNILDQIFVSDSSKSVMEVEVLCPIGESDHKVLILYPKLNACNLCFHEHRVYDLRRNNIDAFITCLNNFNFKVLYDCGDVNLAVELFNKVCATALSVIPHRTVKIYENDKSWMSPKLKLLINDKWAAYRQRNFNKFKALKVKIKQSIITAKGNWIKRNSQTAKSFWSIVNDLTNKNKSSNFLGPLLNLYPDRDILANIINEKFCASFVKSGKMSQTIVSANTKNYFTELEVFTNLAHLNTNKSGPHDDLSARLYKEAASILAKPLCYLMNLSYQSHVVPNTWIKFDVIPTPKTLPVNIDQLRPISLLPIPMKIFEKLILTANKPSILQNIDDQQFGFKPLSSSTCALIDIDNYIRKQLDLNSTKAVCLVTLDFSKAFDKIDHSILIEKMIQMKNINKDCGIDLNWLISYFTHRTQRVRINNTVSNERSASSGVPQGSHLAPYLFDLYVADLSTSNSKSRLTKFADDTSLMFTLQNAEDLIELNDEMSFIFDWAEKNKLPINHSKCKVLFFKKSNPFKCLLPNNIFGINTCKNLTLLGITFNENLCFKDHFNQILKRATQRLYFLRVLKTYYTKENLWKIFNTLIRSILEYAHPIFINLPTEISLNIESIQKRAHKIICGYSNYKTCTDCVLPLLKDRRTMLSLKLFKKITSNKQHPLSNIIHDNSQRSSAFILPAINTNRYRDCFINACSITSNNTFVD